MSKSSINVCKTERQEICVLCHDHIHTNSTTWEDSVVGCAYNVHPECANDRNKTGEFNACVASHFYGDN